ncbi:cytochrome B5 [Salvia miltiorrhiza]|uniref:cytochrome B5 n=1 Tax=Salvia miltiorrhiza TaxID=226208 RepID=UPI0025AD152B|nr:cytochrome B5 [Salvia miltiorrhiza]
MAKAEKVLGFEEMAKHNKKGDCWLLIHGKVYDVTQFLHEHPGGDEVMLNVSGKDASLDFDDIGHTTYAQGLMEDFLIGKIDVTTLPKVEKNTIHDNASSSSSSSKQSDVVSSQLLIYLLPLLILAVAFLLRYYYNKE